MAAPTILGVGVAAAGQAQITPAFPTGFTFEDGDLLVGIGETAGGESFPDASLLSTGFAHVPGSPVTQDSQTRLTVIWRRWTAGLTAHSWGDSGNHNIGCYIAIRGVKTTGDPWNVAPVVAVESTANATVEWPASAATTVADCLALLCIATGRDANSTANMTPGTGGSLTSLAEQMDNWTALGTGGGIGMISGVKTTTGAVTGPATTMGSTDTKALMTLAVEPAAEAPPAAGPPTLVVPPPD